MKQSVCKVILKWLGWSIGPLSSDIPKSVICVAPHTSNRDFFIGKIFYTAIGRNASFLMKKELFFFPLGFFLRAIGGVPINRSEKSSKTDAVAAEFNKHDHYHIAITPEGTRKKVLEWKRGFYFVALKANVPIQLAYIDYKKKEIGFKDTFYPTGNVDEDIKCIKNQYVDVIGRHLEKQ